MRAGIAMADISTAWRGVIAFALLLTVSCSTDDAAPTDSPSAAPTTTRDEPASAEVDSTTTAPDSPSSTAGPDAADDPAESTPAELDDLAGVAGSIVIRSDEGDLVVISPDGAERRQVASADGRVLSQPTWSTGGELLAWSAFGPEGAALEIGSDDDDTRSVALATPPFYLSWSAEDRWIGALRPTTGSIEFLVVQSDDASARPIGAGQPFYFDWRDDDVLIAAINGNALAEIPASPTADPTQLALGQALGVFQAPSMIDASDSTVIALRGETTNDVVVVRDGRAEATLGRARGPVSFSVDPLGQRLAVLVLAAEPQSQVISFQPDEPPDLEAGRVSIIDLETGAVETRPEQRVLAMQWSPDGSKLALLQSSNDELRWLVVDDGDVTALSPFVPSREVAISYLPFADQYNHSTTWWSPDSRAVVLPGAVDGDAGIWVDLVDDDRGAVRIADGDVALWSPR